MNTSRPQDKSVQEYLEEQAQNYTARNIICVIHVISMSQDAGITKNARRANRKCEMPWI